MAKGRAARPSQDTRGEGQTKDRPPDYGERRGESGPGSRAPSKPALMSSPGDGTGITHMARTVTSDTRGEDPRSGESSAGKQEDTRPQGDQLVTYGFPRVTH